MWPQTESHRTAFTRSTFHSPPRVSRHGSRLSLHPTNNPYTEPPSGTTTLGPIGQLTGPRRLWTKECPTPSPIPTSHPRLSTRSKEVHIDQKTPFETMKNTGLLLHVASRVSHFRFVQTQESRNLPGEPSPSGRSGGQM